MQMIYVSIRERTYLFASAEDAYRFLMEAIFSSEGSEREGYVNDLDNFLTYFDYLTHSGVQEMAVYE